MAHEVMHVCMTFYNNYLCVDVGEYGWKATPYSC